MIKTADPSDDDDFMRKLNDEVAEINQGFHRDHPQGEQPTKNGANPYPSTGGTSMFDGDKDIEALKGYLDEDQETD